MRKAIITAAGNMSEETYKYICSSIENKFNEKFEFEKIDQPDIIGGFILNIDQEIYDLSLKTQLENFKNYLLK